MADRQHWTSPFGKVLIEQVAGLHGARDLRATLLQLVLELQDQTDLAAAVCVVSRSRLAAQRIADEATLLKKVIRPDLAERLDWACLGTREFAAGSLVASVPGLTPVLHRLAADSQQRSTFAKAPAQQAVLAALVNDFLVGSGGPRLVVEWQTTCGVSYPTVAKVVADLRRRGLLTAVPARGVALRKLATGELLALAREHAMRRPVMLFRDPTGFATPQRLAKRLHKLQAVGEIASTVAIGGVIGSAHYFPQIDITGPPRLDLCVDDRGFDASHLDGALQPLALTEPASRAVLAVHLSPTVPADLPGALIGPGARASPLDCLADLIEMGFERETLEFLHHLLR